MGSGVLTRRLRAKEVGPGNANVHRAMECSLGVRVIVNPGAGGEFEEGAPGTLCREGGGESGPV